MISLDVPLRKVTKGSDLCQLATALMVMQYYGDTLETATAEAEIRAFSPFTADKNERHSQGMAIWLARRGYDVFYSHHDLRVVDTDIRGCTEKHISRLKAKLNELDGLADDNYRKKKLLLDSMVIESGCRFSNALSDLALVDSFLREKKPVIITVKNSTLNAIPGDRSNHSIVITGKDSDSYNYNDSNFKGPQTISANQLLQGWYAAGAYLLVASKPEANYCRTSA